MIIKGAKTQIVPFTEHHLYDSNYYKWLTNYEVVRYIGRDKYLDKIPFKDVVKYVEDVWSNSFRYFFAIYHAEKSKFIGTATVNFKDQSGFENKIADIGIMIGDTDFWGQGIATDALSAISKYCFFEMKVEKLTAGVMSENLAMIKAFKKNGFVEEGRLRNQLLLPDGLKCDHVLLGCFKYELNAI